MTIGLVNKAKWGQETKWADLSPQIKRTKIILFSVLTIMLLALVIVYFLKNGE
jgi:nitrate reductase NapE component